MVPKSETWRKNFRSVVLLAILGVCAALAWVLAWHKSAPARDGREILAGIRRQGIRQYWTQNVQRRQWFLIRRDGNVVGWEMEFRQAGPDGAGGGFERRTNVNTGQERISARWRLTNNAEEGQYQSQRVEFSRTRAEVSEAKIVLQNRTLQVYQNIDGVRYVSTAAASENYLPEGLMPLAMREVARRQGRARFEMVEDGSHPEESQGGRTPLYPFELRYLGKDSQTGGAMVETSFGGGSSWVTVIDETGNVLRRFGSNVEFLPATREEIQKQFPSAVEVIADDETVEM